MSIGDLLVGAQNSMQGGGMPPGAQASPPGGPGAGAAGVPPPAGQPMPPPQVYGPDQSVGASIQALMRMHENDRRANSLDRGLAMMAGSFGPTETRGAIMNSAQPQNDSLGAMGGAIQDTSGMMQLAQQQRMMQAAPAIAQYLGGGQAGGQGGVGGQGGPVAGAVGAGQPGFTPGGPPASVIAGLPLAVQQQLLEKKIESGMTIGQQTLEEKNKDLQEAAVKTPQQLAQTDDMLTRLSAIQGATNADGTPVMKSILGSDRKIAAANELMNPPKEPGWWTSAEGLFAQAQLTPEEQSTIGQLKQLSNQSYGDAFQSTGSRRTGQEVQNLRAGLNQLTTLNQPYDSYMKQMNNYQQQLMVGKANALGAAGRVDEIPDNMKPFADRSYLPGGANYAGVGGQWASDPKFAFRTPGAAAAPGAPAAGASTGSRAAVDPDPVSGRRRQARERHAIHRSLWSACQGPDEVCSINHR